MWTDGSRCVDTLLILTGHPAGAHPNRAGSASQVPRGRHQLLHRSPVRFGGPDARQVLHARRSSRR